MPSSTSTVWVTCAGTLSGRPASAAAPLAIRAPEIKPPGRFAHSDNNPPALPITSVSSTLRVLARLGMANAIDAGIRFTPPYGKSVSRGQMRHAYAAVRARGVFRGVQGSGRRGADHLIIRSSPPPGSLETSAGDG